MIQGLRESVRLTSRESLRIFHLADIWAARTGTDVRLVSANDHGHTRNSKHYAGLAVDLHASDLDGLARVMRGAGYRVLWRVPGHYSHVHVEVDEPPVGPPAPDRRARVPDIVRARRDAGE